jgi:hypothetical protein
MTTVDLPAPVEEVLTRVHTCELATLAKDHTPIVWPVIGLYLADRGEIVLTTSVALPQKAINIRRDARVSLLFSNPTGSGLDHPPEVMVQGDARVGDGVEVWSEDLVAVYRRIYRVQPFGKRYSANALSRWFMDWYFMRLLIYVTPRSIRWWTDGAVAQSPQTIEMSAGVD